MAESPKTNLTIETPQHVHIVVTGTTTLDPNVVAEMSGLKEKPTMSEEEVRKRLDTSGLFSYLNVSRHDDFVYIRIREKVTFFFLPFISTNPIGTYYSGTVGKQIVFGEDALVVGRYQVGPADHEGLVLIRDGATMGTPVTLEILFGFEDALHWVYSGDTIVSQFENVYHGGHLKIGYRAYPYLSGSIVNYVEQHRYQQVSFTPFESGIQWSTAGILDYDHLYQEDGLTNGFRLKYTFEETNPVSYYRFWRTRVEPTLSVFTHGNLNWVIRGDFSFSPSLPLYQKAELGGDTLRGYDPQEFRDHYYAVIQNDFLLTSTNIWKLNLRTFTFFDWGFINSGGRPSAGAGIQIYPKNIAIAAFQFFLGHGLNPGGTAASASFGANFD